MWVQALTGLIPIIIMILVIAWYIYSHVNLEATYEKSARFAIFSERRLGCRGGNGEKQMQEEMINTHRNTFDG